MKSVHPYTMSNGLTYQQWVLALSLGIGSTPAPVSPNRNVIHGSHLLWYLIFKWFPSTITSRLPSTASGYFWLLRSSFPATLGQSRTFLAVLAPQPAGGRIRTQAMSLKAHTWHRDAVPPFCDVWSQQGL